MSKKKSVKKDPAEMFETWWNNSGSSKVSKIEKKWLKENKPNDPDDEEGGDFWCVNEMMHNGDAHEMTYENAKTAFEKGMNGEDADQCDSLYCELDSVIWDAHAVGKKVK